MMAGLKGKCRFGRD